jgi:predicted carbohydrate-binding protein with CBM5 and CBM33 domain
MVVTALASNAFAHGTIVDSRVYRVRQAGANANLMGAWTDAMYDWAANSRNFPDYASPGFNYSNYIADGTISSAGQNNGTNGHLDFSKLNTPGAWPTSPVTAGTSFAQKWVAPAPHDPSYFDVWITKQGFDVTTETLGWNDLEKLGRWEKNTSLDVVATPNGALSPADNGALLSYDWNIPIPADRVGRHALVVIWQRRDPVGEAFFSTQDILVAAAGATWNLPGNGGYETAANWSGGSVPNAAGAIANFGSSITAPTTVTLSSSATLGTLRFNSPRSYTIAGAGTLMLENNSGSAIVDVQQGDHTISAGVMLHGSTDVQVAASSSLTLGGSLMYSSGNILTKNGPGTLRILTPNVSGASNAMLVNSGGTVQIDSPLSPSIGVFTTGGAHTRFGTNASIGSLTTSTANSEVSIASDSTQPLVVKATSIGVGGGTIIDVGDNALLINYTGASSDFAQLNAVAKIGSDNHHVGPGLVSSVAATNSRMGVGVVEASSIGSPSTFLGTGIDSSTVIARYTFKGDADVNGIVNFDDLLALAQRYNTAGTWRNGDSNYDGTINFDDLLALAQNYNGSLAIEGSAITGGVTSFAADFALALSLAPEPAMLSSVAFAAVGVRRRRLM